MWQTSCPPVPPNEAFLGCFKVICVPVPRAKEEKYPMDPMVFYFRVPYLKDINIQAHVKENNQKGERVWENAKNNW